MTRTNKEIEKMIRQQTITSEFDYHDNLFIFKGEVNHITKELYSEAGVNHDILELTFSKLDEAIGALKSEITKDVIARYEADMKSN